VRQAAIALRVRPGPTLASAAALALGGLCVSALVGGLLAIALGASHAEPHDAIADSPEQVASLFAHNAWVAAIPLGLGALGWDRTAYLDRLGDLVVTGSLIANGAAVGDALTRSGPELLRYLPHLPFEWGAIALGAGSWLSLRVSEATDRSELLLRAAALCAGALLIAAVLEVYAVPLG
jgi:hypothetical protein